MAYNRGFTLIELVAVIIIISILSSIAIPKLNNAIETTNNKAFNNTHLELQNALINFKSNEIIGIPNINLGLEVNSQYLPIVNNNENCSALWTLVDNSIEDMWMTIYTNEGCKFTSKTTNKSLIYNSQANHNKDILTISYP